MTQFIVLLAFEVVGPTNFLGIRIAEIVYTSQSFVNDAHFLFRFHHRIMIRRTVIASLLTSIPFPIDNRVFHERFQYRQKSVPIVT